MALYSAYQGGKSHILSQQLEAGQILLDFGLKLSSELKTIFILGFETKKGDSLRVQGEGVGVAGQG